MASNSKARQDSMVELALSLHESDGCIQVRAEAYPFGEARHSFSIGEIAALEQMRVDAGSLFETLGSQEKLEELGRRLFSALFQGKLREVFESARTAARNRQERFLILIKMEPTSRLYSIPWELLHDGYCFLAKDTRSAVVRYFDQPLPVSHLAVASPLRVLVTSASPSDLEPLSIAEEEAAIRRAYEQAGEKVHLVTERHVSIEKLKRIWRQATAQGEQFHVWHHCGHGGERNHGNQAEFVLCLESAGLKQPVEIERLEEVVSFCPDLRIAVINVCRGSSRIGLAPALARINIPVVIGFQYSVGDTAALEFAEALHESLLNIPAEFAVSLARKSMRINEPQFTDWAQALVLSRRKDRGLLLQIEHIESPPPRDMPTGVIIGTITSSTFEGTNTSLVGSKIPDLTKLPRGRTEIRKIHADLAKWDDLKVTGDAEE